jgi:hypothetical protein
MKKPLATLLSIALIVSCSQAIKSDTSDDPSGRPELEANSAHKPEGDRDSTLTAFGDLFQLTDAEKVLGEPAHLSDSGTRKSASAVVFQSAYKAEKEDFKSKKTGSVYFLLEQYHEIPDAQKKYESTRKANEDHGIQVRNNLGDEAYFHTDSVNFYFIMVRKGARVLSMKVNKVTSTTSLDQFNAVTRKIIDNI